MDQEKPFKTIEVIDSRTKQVCKVACMSCIRGHRTTQCGIPVCRTKVFWTVKRPGRPSNSCTCRYGATGGCKCVVAKSACPHKAKKGEKRTGECRCDEQGRYCCLLEPEHWTALHALQKPTVNFFPTRELLDENQAGSNYTSSVPQTPTYPLRSPPSTNSVPRTPINTINNGYGNYPSMQSSSLTPRFGLMDVGAHLQPTHSHLPDLLPWEGHAPPTPREIVLPPVYESVQAERSSCCQQSTPQTQSIHSPLEPRTLSFSQANSLQDLSSYNHRVDSVSLPPTLPPVYETPPFDFSRMQAQYYANQFPNAMCQSCGLSGCTCRNCPPIFQNFASTSWAQCCGRKHAMDMQPSSTAPPATKMLRREGDDGESLRVQAAPPPPSHHGSAVSSYLPPESLFGGNGQYSETFPTNLDAHHHQPRPPNLHSSHQPSGFDAFDLDSELLIPDTGQHLDISEFLLSDLDRGRSEAAGRGEGGNDRGAEGICDTGDGRDRVEDQGGGGGGGCCCR